MRTFARWLVAIAGSLAVFAGSWAGCWALAGLDSGTALGIASAVLAPTVTLLGWWAAREPAVMTHLLSAGVDHGRGVVADGPGPLEVGGSPAEPIRPSPAVPARATDTSIVVGDIPQQPPAFQDRDRLIAMLSEPPSRSAECVIHAITGMRGVGKTQIAAAYARRRITDRWRLVAWVNAETGATCLDGLAQTAAAVGIAAPGGDQVAAGNALRHWLEVDGSRCLIVFDNAQDPDQLRRYLPATGGAHIVITSVHQSMATLGAGIPVSVFTEAEALAYLALRTSGGNADGGNCEDARDLATELGRLPLALAQAAAVIAAQRISYHAYLTRLRALPISDYLARSRGDPYPRGTAAATVLSLQAAHANDGSGLSTPIMNLIALLSPAGVPRSLLHTAHTVGLLSQSADSQGQPPLHDSGVAAGIGAAAEVDAALASAFRLAVPSLDRFRREKCL